MNTLNLYQPGKIDVSFPFPSEWNELSTSDLLDIAQSFLENTLTNGQNKALVFLRMFKRYAPAKYAEEFQCIPSQQLANVSLNALDFVYSSNQLTKQPFPTLSVGRFWNKKILTGKLSDFDDLTCGEFERCEQFVNEFKADPKPEPLANLAAILYRPRNTYFIQIDPNTMGEKTYPFEKMVRHMLRLNPNVLFTIYLWYIGCREQLPKIFPECFDGDGKADQADFMAFTKSIHAGARGTSESRTRIRVTLLKEFMFEMQQQKIENDRITAEMERNARK